MKKGRRALENTTSSSSDSPSTPDYDLNLQENALSDEQSTNVDFKAIPIKSKQRAGWMDEPVRSASSGKYVDKVQIDFFCSILQICFRFSLSGIVTNPPKVKCKFFLSKIQRFSGKSILYHIGNDSMPFCPHHRHPMTFRSCPI